MGDFGPRAFQSGDQDHEFIAAQTRHRILGAHAGFQACGDDLQHAVADRVTERVVDVLEVVEVEKQ